MIDNRMPYSAPGDDSSETWNAWARSALGLARPKNATADELREAIALRLEKLEALERRAAELDKLAAKLKTAMAELGSFVKFLK